LRYSENEMRKSAVISVCFILSVAASNQALAGKRSSLALAVAGTGSPPVSCA